MQDMKRHQTMAERCNPLMHRMADSHVPNERVPHRTAGTGITSDAGGEQSPDLTSCRLSSFQRIDRLRCRIRGVCHRHRALSAFVMKTLFLKKTRSTSASQHCRHALALASLLLSLSTLSATAQAEMHEVKMLNRGPTGSMVYDPEFIRVKPGDVVKFRATTSGHNAASIDGMTPEGAPGFKGKINEEIEVKFDQEGLYGVKCSPHYAMGMVMLIQVGDKADPATLSIPDSVPARSRKRFEKIIESAGN